MTDMKKAFRLALAAAAVSLAMPAAGALAETAQTVSAERAAYETKATDYIASRLVDARGATFRQVGTPYEVTAQLNNGRNYDCVAVDMMVRSDLSRTRGTSTYTVLFLNGRAVALESDLSRSVVRVNRAGRLASR